METAVMVQVLQDILEEYRAIHLEGSPITWVRQMAETTKGDGLVLCVKSGDTFRVTVEKI